VAATAAANSLHLALSFQPKKAFAKQNFEVGRPRGYVRPVLDSLSDHLRQGRSLSTEQVEAALRCLVDERLDVESKAGFLTGLARKGETIEEIAAFARGLREYSLQPPVDAATRSRGILDVVGTGGDRLNTFNISTTAALVVSAAGVVVAKHGNRAVTSRSGSADVLEALGIRTDLAPDQAAGWLREHGFAFLFAPRYHPAFKHIAPARKLCAERGQPTIFNFLGPLLNPVRPHAQLVGVPRPHLCEIVGRVLQSLGVGRGMVVCGRVGPDAWLDELSTLGETVLAEFYQERGFATATLPPGQFPVRTASLADLVGGDAAANADTARRILRAEERGPKRDAVLLNAAAALLVAGKSRTLTDGWELAATVIDEGKAAAKLDELVQAGREV
jgi:anthranilate phosphoribosyltransferase